MGMGVWRNAAAFTAFGLFLGVTIANMMWTTHFGKNREAGGALMRTRVEHPLGETPNTGGETPDNVNAIPSKNEHELQLHLDVADSQLYAKDLEIEALKQLIGNTKQQHVKQIEEANLKQESLQQEAKVMQESLQQAQAKQESLAQAQQASPKHEVELPNHDVQDSLDMFAGQPIPVWVWMDYKSLPGFIELNLRALVMNAPEPDFVIRYVNKNNILDWVPDMPEEFVRMPYAAATSDLIRTALIANHGGVYLDTDFVVTRPLHDFTDLLKDFDFVSYTSHGQNCQDAQFSSNFIAGRPGNQLYAQTWQKIKDSLKQKCMHNDGDTEQGVCCYTSDGEPRKCHIPWAGVGERLSHPILKDVLENDGFKIHCLNDAESFVPVLRNSKNTPSEYKLDSGHIAWTVLDGDVCKRVGDDLVCRGTDWQANSTAYFSRLAYHQFSSIMSNNKKGTSGPLVPYRKLRADEILHGDWAVSELYRKAFAGETPPQLNNIEDIVPEYEPIELTAVPERSWPKQHQAAKAVIAVDDVDSQCNTTLSKYLGQPLNRSDDFQCAPLNLSFVHIPKSAGTTLESIGRKMGIVWGHDYDEKRWNMIKAINATDPAKALAFPSVSSTHPDINTCRTGCYCKKGCCWWHIPPRYLQDWRPYYSAPLKFCVVRNPFGRMLSQYSYSGVWQCPNTTELLDKRDEYIRSNILRYRDDNFKSQADCHFIPQHEFVSSHIGADWMNQMWDTPLAPSDALSHILGPSSALSEEDGRSCNIVLRFEHLADDLDALSTWTGVNVRTKWNKPYTSKCTKALRQETVDLIKEVFAEDFAKFNYDPTWPVY
eukprot:m.149615 g.149615  ORF g.149615 m.149615 type:complete len:824 (+) comp30671_c0_seq1:178-2649(+)